MRTTGAPYPTALFVPRITLPMEAPLLPRNYNHCKQFYVSSTSEHKWSVCVRQAIVVETCQRTESTWPHANEDSEQHFLNASREGPSVHSGSLSMRVSCFGAPVMEDMSL